MNEMKVKKTQIFRQLKYLSYSMLFSVVALSIVFSVGVSLFLTVPLTIFCLFIIGYDLFSFIKMVLTRVKQGSIEKEDYGSLLASQLVALPRVLSPHLKVVEEYNSVQSLIESDLKNVLIAMQSIYADLKAFNIRLQQKIVECSDDTSEDYLKLIQDKKILEAKLSSIDGINSMVESYPELPDMLLNAKKENVYQIKEATQKIKEHHAAFMKMVEERLDDLVAKSREDSQTIILSRTVGIY